MAALRFRESERMQVAWQETGRPEDGWRQLLEVARHEDGSVRITSNSRCARTRCTWSRNAIVLRSFILFYATITFAQFLGAWYAQSMALLADCSSMLVDVIAYLGAAWAEGASHGKARKELVISGLSLCALWGVTIPVVTGSVLIILRREEAELESGESGVEDTVDPRIILAFSVLGIICDGLSIACFKCNESRASKKRPRFRREKGGSPGLAARHQYALPLGDQDLLEEKDAPQGGSNGDDEAPATLNMRSAFAHVLADTCRSLVTGFAAVLILFYDFDPEKTDAKCSLVVAAFVLTASGDVCCEWWRLVLSRVHVRLRKERADTLEAGMHTELSPVTAAAELSPGTPVPSPQGLGNGRSAS